MKKNKKVKIISVNDEAAIRNINTPHVFGKKMKWDTNRKLYMHKGVIVYLLFNKWTASYEKDLASITSCKEFLNIEDAVKDIEFELKDWLKQLAKQHKELSKLINQKK